MQFQIIFVDEFYQLSQDLVSRLKQSLPGQPKTLHLPYCHTPVLRASGVRLLRRDSSSDTVKEDSEKQPDRAVTLTNCQVVYKA